MKLSRRAARMQRHHGRMHNRSSLNLVSLMDIFTILVFFLMVNQSDVEILQNNEQIQLPDSLSEQTPILTLLITVSQNDIIVNGRPIVTIEDAMASEDVEITALKVELEYQAQRSLPPEEEDAGRPVTILGDKGTPYQLIKRILATCAEVDYTDISLAVNHKAADVVGATGGGGLADG